MTFDNPISLAAWTGATLVAIVCSLYIGRAVMMRPAYLYSSAVASALLTWSALSLYAIVASPEPCTIMITSPPARTEIRSHRLDVSGVVEPHTARVTLAVRSESDKQWWIQEVVSPDSVSGRWSIKPFIGEPAVGKGKIFELLALSSDDTFLFNVLTARYLYRGLTMRELPRWNRSQPLTIRRTE